MEVKDTTLFKERLLKEYTDLVERIAMLDKYLSVYINCENSLLEKQLKIMIEYRGVLQLRILELMGGNTNEK